MKAIKIEGRAEFIVVLGFVYWIADAFKTCIVSDISFLTSLAGISLGADFYMRIAIFFFIIIAGYIISLTLLNSKKAKESLPFHADIDISSKVGKILFSQIIPFQEKIRMSAQTLSYDIGLAGAFVSTYKDDKIYVLNFDETAKIHLRNKIIYPYKEDLNKTFIEDLISKFFVEKKKLFS